MVIAWLVTTLLACSQTAPPPAPEPAPAPAPAPVEVQVDPNARWRVLAPSPLDLDNEIRQAGVAQGLADLLPKQLPAMPPADDKDRVAFRTGVVFAYTLLGGRTMEKEALVAQVKSLREGMATIGTGPGLLATMDKAIQALVNDSADREEFLAELDTEVASSVPEEGWAPNDTTGPMLQAGAWLAGTNLVAKAVVNKGSAATANVLLRRPEVPDFFLKYLQTAEGAAKAGSTQAKVAETLAKLKELTSAPEIGLDQAKGIAEATDNLLTLL